MAVEDDHASSNNNDAKHGTGPVQPTSNSSASIPRRPVSSVPARDITSDFTKASSALKTGQLVKDDFFTLFESVAALEIMDPKMDSGYLAPGETFQDEYDVIRTLLPEEVIGIMDQLLCHEMAWHMGSPLSQTLFTSLYMDNLLSSEPKALKTAQFGSAGMDPGSNSLLHTVLRAYCLALIKCCGFVHCRIGNEHYYEEEDFVGQTYNRDLLNAVSEREILALVEEALHWLEENLGGLDTVKNALKSRLQFRKSFLSALASDDSDFKNGPVVHWDECSALIPRIEESTSVGKPVLESFSVKVQRKLASTVPPRPIVEIGFDTAVAHLTRLCQDGKDVLQVLNHQGSNNLMTFVWSFQSRKPQPSVYIRAVLQSLLFSDMTILHQMSLKQLLFEDLADIVLPADMLLDEKNWEVEVPNDPRFEIARRMDSFVTRAAQSYLDLFRALCQNRSRMRRTLCHTAQDWDNLQLEAEELDAEFQALTKEEPIVDESISPEPIFAFPLSSWAYHHKLHQMEWIIQLGFELDVYQADELAGMYWYLQHITQTRIGHLERIRGFVARKLTRTGAQLAQDHKDAITKALSFLYYTMLEASTKHVFAEGLTCLYTILARLSLARPPPRPYSSDALRYELRMKPFLHISLPELVPFGQFRALIAQRSQSIPVLLNHASHAFAAARKSFETLGKLDAHTSRSVLCEAEWRASVKNAQRACIAASIAVSTLEKGLVSVSPTAKKADEERRDREEDKLRSRVAGWKVDVPPGNGLPGQTVGRYHDWWVVPKVTAPA